MTANFAATIEAWAGQTKGDITRIFRESAERVIEEMQTPIAAGGNMPVDTGFLRASLQVSLNGPAPMSRENPGSPASYNAGVASLVIAGADVGQTIWASYTASYAAHVHYGANGRPGRQFVTLAAQRWPTIVAQVTAEAKARSQAS